MKRIPTHVGVVLRDEFLVPMKVTQKRFAAHIGVSAPFLNDLIQGRHGISVSVALRIAGALGTTPEFWLNLQMKRDLHEVRSTSLKISRIK